MNFILRSTFLTLLLYLSLPLQAQEQYDYTWLLGYPPNLPDKFAGGDRIDFNTGSPMVSYFEIPTGLWVPCVVSDRNGTLQFYSNGCEIRNYQHQLMENGEGINSGPIHDQYCIPIGKGYPAVNSLLTLPFPGHEGQYYFFHMRQYDIGYHLTWDLLWSRVDMAANEGLGKVLEKNMPLVQDTLLPSISAVRHANGRDWWIIVGEQFNDDTYCFLLDTSGIQHAPTIRHESWIGSDQMPNVICFSPNGKKLARGGHGTPAAFRIYDFDRSTGQISNPITVDIPEAESYDIWPCFSPNSRYLYLTNEFSRLYQYDTWATDINTSVKLVGEYDGFQADYGLPTTLFSMTTGPDQRIYMLANNSTRYMHVIRHPDERGQACDFRQHDFQMPAFSVFFLPNMPYYRLYNEPGSACDTLGVQPPMVAQWRSEPDSLSSPRSIAFTDISYFQPTSWHWTFGDGDSSSLPEPLHAYAASGQYEVCLVVCNDAGLCDTLCRNITVQTLSGTTQPGPVEVSASVWPNPANAQIFLAYPENKESEFRLFDLDGRPVLRQILLDNRGIESWMVRSLPKGLYFWQLCQAGKSVKSGKLVIQH